LDTVYHDTTNLRSQNDDKFETRVTNEGNTELQGRRQVLEYSFHLFDSQLH